MCLRAWLGVWLLLAPGTRTITTMAAPSPQEKEALRGVVLSSLSTILSGDQQQRKDAEEELKALEVTEGL